jgi:hypothetical protein
MHRHMQLSRSGFLRLGATGMTAAASGMLGAGAAVGSPPALDKRLTVPGSPGGG